MRDVSMFLKNPRTPDDEDYVEEYIETSPAQAPVTPSSLPPLPESPETSALVDKSMMERSIIDHIPRPQVQGIVQAMKRHEEAVLQSSNEMFINLRAVSCLLEFLWSALIVVWLVPLQLAKYLVIDRFIWVAIHSTYCYSLELLGIPVGLFSGTSLWSRSPSQLTTLFFQTLFPLSASIDFPFDCVLDFAHALVHTIPPRPIYCRHSHHLQTTINASWTSYRRWRWWSRRTTTCTASYTVRSPHCFHCAPCCTYRLSVLYTLWPARR